MTALRFSLFIALAALMLIASPGASQAQDSQSAASFAGPRAERDRDAVRDAVLNYVDALYLADTSLVVESVHPDLVKYGYFRRDGVYGESPMSYDALKELSTRWNADQARVDPDSARRQVVVFDVLDKTASAKVVAHWGIDYLLLAKIDGRWMIRQILWQSHPPTP